MKVFRVARFLEKIEPRGHPSGCWVWGAATSTAGYGRFHDGSRIVQAHRWAYEHFIGPIPEGLQLDHLCRNRACVNPVHLEPVTCRENLLRGEGLTAKCAAATHCPQGHPYDDANTRMHAGSRECRTCDNARRRRNYYKAKEARNACV